MANNARELDSVAIFPYSKLHDGPIKSTGGVRCRFYDLLQRVSELHAHRKASRPDARSGDRRRFLDQFSRKRHSISSSVMMNDFWVFLSFVGISVNIGYIRNLGVL